MHGMLWIKHNRVQVEEFILNNTLSTEIITEGRMDTVGGWLNGWMVGWVDGCRQQFPDGKIAPQLTNPVSSPIGELTSYYLFVKLMWFPHSGDAMASYRIKMIGSWEVWQEPSYLYIYRMGKKHDNMISGRFPLTVNHLKWSNEWLYLQDSQIWTYCGSTTP